MRSAEEQRPSLIIGGAQKAGTTALFYMLGQHPAVYLAAVKEPDHFSARVRPGRPCGPGAAAHQKGVIGDPREYARLFDPGAELQHRVEASTSYMAESGVAREIRAFDSEIRLIFLLRDPALRAYSAYSFLRQRNLEPCPSFAQAAEEEDRRLRAGWPHSYGYLRLSSYGDRLAEYLDEFPRDQILLLNYETLRRDPTAVLREVERFASLEPYNGYAVGDRYNPSGTPRSRLLQAALDLQAPRLRGRLRQLLPDGTHRWIVGVRDRNLARGPALSAADRSWLIDRLQPQIEAIRAIAGDSMVEGWDRA